MFPVCVELYIPAVNASWLAPTSTRAGYNLQFVFFATAAELSLRITKVPFNHPLPAIVKQLDANGLKQKPNSFQARRAIAAERATTCAHQLICNCGCAISKCVIIALCGATKTFHRRSIDPFPGLSDTAAVFSVALFSKIDESRHTYLIFQASKGIVFVKAWLNVRLLFFTYLLYLKHDTRHANRRLPQATISSFHHIRDRIFR